jgi:PAS domain S-box-containing protein
MFSTLKSIFQRNAALKVAFIYALFSALWIIFSDQILLLFVEEAQSLTRLQTLKGWAFIIITALIVYFLLQEEITKLREAEGEAKENQRKLFTLMGNLPGMAYRCRNDEHKTMELVSNGCFGLTGYQADELLHNRRVVYSELIHPADQEGVRERVRLATAGGQPFQLTYRLITATGEEKWVWEQGVGITAGNGDIVALEGFVTDITEEKRSEEALARYRDRLEDLVMERTLTLKQEIVERQRAEEQIRKSYQFETTISAVLKTALEPLSLDEQLARILDLILAVPLLSLRKKGCIFLVEDEPGVLVMKAQQGLTEEAASACARIPLGKCLCGKAAGIAGPMFADQLAECHQCHGSMFPHGHYCMPIMSGDKLLGVLNLQLKERHRRDQHEEGFLSSIAATLAGIIERKKAEQERERLQKQLIETEKLSALGRMMANVAHEVRNPLTALGGLARRLDRRIPDGTKEKEYTGVIISESARLERILKNVLTFTKEPSPHRQEQDLSEVIEESLRPFAASLQKKSIELRKALAQIPPVLINREDVKEVIGNLLSNAIYATPAGGSITIGTAREYLEGAPYVTVKVTDTGPGITEDRLGLIFEPFYTTKPVGPGHGIGLGLSTSRKIMEEHGGLIRVESKPGAGTAFSLFFPEPGTWRLAG